MKTISLLLFLLLSLVSPDLLLAQEVEETVSATSRQIAAFDLVNAAYRGSLKEWGIPAYARLDQAYRGRQITALDLVEAAVKAKRLSPEALEDKAYVHAVDINLYGLVTR